MSELYLNFRSAYAWPVSSAKCDVHVGLVQSTQLLQREKKPVKFVIFVES